MGILNQKIYIYERVTVRTTENGYTEPKIYIYIRVTVRIEQCRERDPALLCKKMNQDQTFHKERNHSKKGCKDVL